MGIKNLDRQPAEWSNRFICFSLWRKRTKLETINFWISLNEKKTTILVETNRRTGITITDHSSNRKMISIVSNWIENITKNIPERVFGIINDHPSGSLKLIIKDYVIDYVVDKIVLRAGIYYPDSNEILLSEKNSNDYCLWRYIITHEIGHAYHWKAWDSQDIFVETYEKEEPPTEYAKTNYLEDFADTFVLYFLRPNYLKEKAPLRYEKMKELLQ